MEENSNLTAERSLEIIREHQGLVSGIIIVLFAFVGLTLPGLMLKRQK